MRIKKHLKACLQGLFFLILVSIFLFSCNPDDLYETSPDSKVQFSNDTIIFDTVFTSIGTATRNLRVYNPYSRTIKISEIRLAGGKPGSQFKNWLILCFHRRGKCRQVPPLRPNIRFSLLREPDISFVRDLNHEIRLVMRLSFWGRRPKNLFHPSPKRFFATLRMTFSVVGQAKTERGQRRPSLYIAFLYVLSEADV